MNLPNFKKAKAGLLATLAIGTMAVASGFSPVSKIVGIELQKPAQAYQSWEHPWTPGSYWGVNLNSMSQSQADTYCRDRVKEIQNRTGAWVYLYSDDGTIRRANLVNWIWAHRSNNYCMLNY
jgi:hypothetical protein